MTLPARKPVARWDWARGECAAAANRHQDAPKPNILFILVDDLGYAEVGFNRDVPDPEVKTPNVDSLVSDIKCMETAWYFSIGSMVSAFKSYLIFFCHFHTLDLRIHLSI